MTIVYRNERTRDFYLSIESMFQIQSQKYVSIRSYSILALYGISRDFMYFDRWFQTMVLNLMYK